MAVLTISKYCTTNELPPDNVGRSGGHIHMNICTWSQYCSLAARGIRRQTFFGAAGIQTSSAKNPILPLQRAAYNYMTHWNQSFSSHPISVSLDNHAKNPILPFQLLVGPLGSSWPLHPKELPPFITFKSCTLISFCLRFANVQGCESQHHFLHHLWFQIWFSFIPYPEGYVADEISLSFYNIQHPHSIGSVTFWRLPLSLSIFLGT